MMSVHLKPGQLFGGAVTLELPEGAIDASDLRQIPDNQEVFLFPHSDTALVLEILELVTEGGAHADLWEAAKFHFGSIAHDNASLHSEILSSSPPIPSHPAPCPTVEQPAQTPTPVTLIGTQKIHKFSHDPTGAPRPGHEADVPDTVLIFLSLWRVWLESEGGGKKAADVVLSVNVNLSAEDGSGEVEKRRVDSWWKKTVDSLLVADFELFGDLR